MFRTLFIVALAFIWAEADKNASMLEQRPALCPLISQYGYACESYAVETLDDFLLGLNRIVPKVDGAPAIFLQHGLFDTGATWVNNFPHQSLGFILHDAGYDVWIGNSRGTQFSDENTKLTTRDKEYWNSIDTDMMAEYDTTAFINFILKHTGHKKIAYAGHSQGTTTAFMALSRDWDSLQDKISILLALAPVAYVNHLTSRAFRTLASIHATMTLRILGINQMLWNSEILKLLGVPCNFVGLVCNMAIQVLAGGAVDDNMNTSRFDYYLSWEPGATSVRNMEHWTQLVNRPGLVAYDFGTKPSNLARYGQSKPPPYNLSAIAIPVALYVGGSDLMTNPKDWGQLLADLPSNVNTIFRFHPKYGHLDFVWGINAHKDLYPDLLNDLAAHHGPGCLEAPCKQND